MIVVRLYAGLGNQMFQYAAGRRLAHALGVNLKLDVSDFEKYLPRRRYGLGYFEIQERFATFEEMQATRRIGIGRRLAARLRGRAPRAAAHYVEKHFHFDPAVLTLPDGVCLDGYWQSEKYFADIAELIRREFTLRVPPTEQSRRLEAQIAATEAVSLHIRRGDYVTDPIVVRKHGTLPLDYYDRCIRAVEQIVAHPHFFVFSDEPRWARENLKLAHPATFVAHEPTEATADIEDLRLMGKCRHHIIANSSFSWWGAWLNPSAAKRVLAPKQWFTEEALASMRVEDLFPPGWTTL